MQPTNYFCDKRSMKLLFLCTFCLLASEIVILYNNHPLTDEKKTLNSYGLKDGDLVTLQHISSVSSRSKFDRNKISQNRLSLQSFPA